MRAFLVALRGEEPGEAIDGVRKRVMRQLDHRGGLRRVLQRNSEFRPETLVDGTVALGVHTGPDSARLMNVLSNYARGLHYWSVGEVVPPDAVLSIERLFHRQTRPAAYWEPMLAAADVAAGGRTVTRGTSDEFRLRFRELHQGDLLSVAVLHFYNSFPYVALICRPGTDPAAMRLPF